MPMEKTVSDATQPAAADYGDGPLLGGLWDFLGLRDKLDSILSKSIIEYNIIKLPGPWHEKVKFGSS